MSLTSEGAEIAQRAILLADKLLPYVFGFNGQLRSVELVSPELTRWGRNEGCEEEMQNGGRVTVRPLVRGEPNLARDLTVRVHAPRADCLIAAISERGRFIPLGAQDPRVPAG